MSELGHEPLSWLLLDRYALDELTPPERARVDARLAVSRQDRACLEAILSDSSELPRLPDAGKRARAMLQTPVRSDARGSPRGWPWFGAGLAAAAVVALTLLRGPELPPSQRRLQGGVKGGDVALALYSERYGWEPQGFAEGERFKLLVTCPPGWRAPLRVLVFQQGQRYEPLEIAAEEPFECGNRVPWPGAFQLTGEADADVCVAWAEHAPALRARELGEDAVCLHLRRRRLAQLGPPTGRLVPSVREWQRDQ